MRPIVRVAAIMMLLPVFNSLAAGGDGISVVATVPNLGTLAEAVGGERVDVTTIASGLQDAHFVDPKPSYIVRLRSARLFLVNGLDLEIGWVPPLTEGARNPRILRSAAGYIDCSEGIEVMEVPTGPISRAMGDVHPFGNPHYLTDPLNAVTVARRLAGLFSREAPADRKYFQDRLDRFVSRLHTALFGAELVDLVGGDRLARLAMTGQLEDYLGSTVVDGEPLSARLGGWLGRLRPHAGAGIVTYHRDYSYFVHRFGLTVVDYIEPKPGIPPSAKHLAELTDRLRNQQVSLIITRPYVEKRSTARLHEQTGVPVITLPLEAGGAAGTSDYFALFDHVVGSIDSAIGAASKRGSPGRPGSPH